MTVIDLINVIGEKDSIEFINAEGLDLLLFRYGDEISALSNEFKNRKVSLLVYEYGKFIAELGGRND